MMGGAGIVGCDIDITSYYMGVTGRILFSEPFYDAIESHMLSPLETAKRLARLFDTLQRSRESLGDIQAIDDVIASAMAGLEVPSLGDGSRDLSEI